VTHDQVEAMSMADRIVVMHHGSVQQVADPITLYDFPANMFVASFIGSPAMNLKPATVTGQGYQIGAAQLLSAPSGTATIGVRPEHLTPSAGAGALEIAGKIALIETLGGETLLHLDDGQTVWQVKLAGHPTVKMGEAMTVSAQKENIHFFSKDGLRL